MAEPEPDPRPDVAPGDAVAHAAPGDAVASAALPPLPEAVRLRVTALAADALGALPAEEVPAQLQRFARFTPAKRARLAGVPIAAAVDGDPTFRQRVADRVRAALPLVADEVTAGRLPSAAPPADVAAVAYLLRPPGWPDLVRDCVAAAREDEASATAATQAAASRRAHDQLRAARASVRADVEKLRAEVDRLRRDNEELRHRLGDARERARRAEAAAEEQRATAATEVAGAEGRAAAAEVEARRLRTRLGEVESAAEATRRAAREGRSAGDARLWLLLETLVNAAQGLRRELALPPPAARPADLVTDERAVAPFAGVGVRGLEHNDPALLDQLLALPGVHLMIDGYNVTMAGYGTLPLEVQRSRLLGGLAALAARTNVEVTCVFDGAELTGPVPTAAPRGVRVRFSAPGETADELIRRLARAEPPGRPVVVVSSDREVADGVRRAGAWPVPSPLLLRRLDRG